MEQLAPPMDVVFGKFCDSDVVVFAFYCVYKVYQSASEDPTRANNFCKEVKLPNKGL